MKCACQTTGLCQLTKSYIGKMTLIRRQTLRSKVISKTQYGFTEW